MDSELPLLLSIIIDFILYIINTFLLVLLLEDLNQPDDEEQDFKLNDDDLIYIYNIKKLFL